MNISYEDIKLMQTTMAIYTLTTEFSIPESVRSATLQPKVEKSIAFLDDETGKLNIQTLSFENV